MPLGTPFHDRTAVLNENLEWRNWSGYFSAGTYEPNHEREYWAIRNAAALIDISPLFKYDLTGPDALKLVNKIVTRDVSKCAEGQIMYAPWCDKSGHIIDDGTVWRISKEYFRMTAADPNLRWFQDNGFGMRVEVKDVSANLAALALQGPLAGQVIRELAPNADIEALAYYHLMTTKEPGFPLTITRTGFTGDLGYELWVSPEHALRLWDLLLDVGRGYGLLPAGMVALDIARIEAGMLLIEVDYVSSQRALTEARLSSPYEAGLGWTVALNKGPFNGRKALTAEKEAGPKWDLVGLEIDWPALEQLFAAYDLPPLVAGRSSREAVPVYNQNGRQIGQITSSTFSPILKRYIALATVEIAYAKPGAQLKVELTVEYKRQTCPAEVVKKPFYNPAHKKESFNGG